MCRSLIVWSVLVYGLLVLTFGLLGYLRAGSHASLWSGLIFGILLVISASLLALKKRVGATLTFWTALALTTVFGIRYAMTGKSLPAAFAVLSACFALLFLVQLFVKGVFSRGEGSPKEK